MESERIRENCNKATISVTFQLFQQITIQMNKNIKAAMGKVFNEILWHLYYLET